MSAELAALKGRDVDAEAAASVVALEALRKQLGWKEEVLAAAPTAEDLQPKEPDPSVGGGEQTVHSCCSRCCCCYSCCSCCS